jgi:hypothetical protein
LVAVIALLLFFQLAAGGNSASTRRSRPQLRQTNLFQGALGNFNTSLEMKENADFLLTPALLVQEAVSEDVVITYPSE